MALHADNIFKIFRECNQNFYQQLKNIEKNIELRGDNTCLRKGLTVVDNIIRHQKCKGCNYISRFFKDDIIDEKIKILVGKKKNFILLVNKSQPDIFKIENCPSSNSLLNLYNKKIIKFYREEHHTELVDFFQTTNKFLNLAIINIILSNLMREKNYPTGNNFVYYYICNNVFNYFSFKHDIENLKELAAIPNHLEKETCKKILIQIIIFFKFFSSYYFLHNQPSIEFLKFDIELINFAIDNKIIVSPITVYIEPSFFSSISLFNQKSVKRFFNQNNYQKQFSDLPFEDYDIDFNGSKSYNINNLDIEYVEGYLEKRIFFYKIGNRDEDFLEMRRHKGIPLAAKSFDIVCFLVSLLLNQNYYENYIKNYRSLIIWKGLWKKEDYDNLMKDMENWRDNKYNNFQLVFLIVKKYYIRFDALEYLYNSFL